MVSTLLSQQLFNSTAGLLNLDTGTFYQCRIQYASYMCGVVATKLEFKAVISFGISCGMLAERSGVLFHKNSPYTIRRTYFISAP